MPGQRISTLQVFEWLEAFHGRQGPCWPTDPYRSIVWWHCGYPPSDARCAKGWESLSQHIGVEPHDILAVPAAQLTRALAPGGMVPELRATRLKAIAERVLGEFGGDLHRGLSASPAKARKVLRTFPNIADPGADRILLFGGIAPVAAVPSNCPHVLVRIQLGQERENYGVTYREAQHAIEAEVGENFEERTRAYLLLKRHGQEICRSAKPKCEKCPVSAFCSFFAGSRRGRAVEA